MLIKFTVENWKSYRDSTEMSMIASREQQHSQRLARIKRYNLRVLPIAALYGGNASGKTNFFSAIAFAKKFILEGLRPRARIPVERFALDKRCGEKPAQFTFEILVQEQIYEFTFVVTSLRVLEEKLTKVGTTSEKVLYHRCANDKDQSGDSSIELHPSIKERRLQFIFEGTRDNQLFLTNSISQNHTAFKDVYDWFERTLLLITPDSRFNASDLFIKEGFLSEKMNDALANLDTGISRLQGEEIAWDRWQAPDEIKQAIRKDLAESLQGDSGAIRYATDIMMDGQRFVVSWTGEQLQVTKLHTLHLDTHGKEVPFDWSSESDGTLRLMDLLPAFLMGSFGKRPRVVIIDELDRSMHSLLTRQLVAAYLSCCTDGARKQMLFTTHDLMLMTQSLFRRDELWVSERNADGVTELIGFSEYGDMRKDKDIRRSYFQGRLGGVPRVLDLDWSSKSEESAAE